MGRMDWLQIPQRVKEKVKERAREKERARGKSNPPIPLRA